MTTVPAIDSNRMRIVDRMIDVANEEVTKLEQAAKRAVKVKHSPDAVKAASLYPVPDDSALAGEFTPAPDIERIANELIERHGLIAESYRLIYLWRAKGGKSKGRRTLGKATKPTGLLGYFAPADFVIWLAADHLRESVYREVEAVVFHELKHVGETTPDPEDDGAEPEAALVGHDYEGFIDELATYGTTVRDLRPIVATAQQLTLEGLSDA